MINDDYELHSKGGPRIAEDYFTADRVFHALCERAMD
jgi:hypothetical protein